MTTNNNELKQEFLNAGREAVGDHIFNDGYCIDLASIADWWLDKLAQDRKELRKKIEDMKQPLVTETLPPMSYAYNKALEDILSLISE